MTDNEERPFEHSGNERINDALAFGGLIFQSPEHFDLAIDHVLTLLTDAATLFERQSFGSAAFFAITAMEETAKAHVGVFRRDKPGPRPKGRDPLRDHTAKAWYGYSSDGFYVGAGSKCSRPRSRESAGN